jgi:hypothetical protein
MRNVLLCNTTTAEYVLWEKKKRCIICKKKSTSALLCKNNTQYSRRILNDRFIAEKKLDNTGT